MSNPKERHYWTQLRAALTAGHWRSDSPAKTPNGHPLSWSELFRKFNKHCKGYQEVADVSLQTLLLAKLLAEAYPDDEQDADVLDLASGGLGDVKAAAKRQGQLDINRETMLSGLRLEKASSGNEALKSLQSSNFDTIHLALAYYAYALGNPSDCLAYLEKVPELLQIQNHIPTVGSTRSTAQNSLAPSSYAPSINSYAGSFTSLVDPIVPEVRDGRGWAMTETFRSLCLQGMSHEILSPAEPQKALSAYNNALPLFVSLQSDFTPKSLPKSSGKLDFTVFHQLRELWRWVERLLWRAVIISSRTSGAQREGQSEPQLWSWLDCYAACSACWPPTFRTVHRSTIYTVHIRALVLRNRALSPIPVHLDRKVVSPPSVPSVAPTSVSNSTAQLSAESQSSASSAIWLHSARTIVQEYRAVLTSSTKFPRAGERNMKVEEFVDLCVAIWEAHDAVGEQVGWVIDILWWATRLTFNSSRVLRHMTRLLHLGGDTNLAKRTLKLYIQVVGKAYEASKEGIGEDKDTDEYWVDTLVFGARMLLKSAAARSGLEGIDDVKLAGTVLDKAKVRLLPENKEMVARVLLAEGIHWSILAVKGQEPLEKRAQLEAAHEAFQKSILEHSTPSAYYHLALSFARRGGPVHDLDRAIECAGYAVEGEPREVRYWHLLGILLTGAEKWAEAKEIFERGSDLDIDEDEDDAQVDAGSATEEGKDSITVTHSDTQTLVVPGSNGVIHATDFSPRKVNGSASAAKNEDADAVTVTPTRAKQNGNASAPKSKTISSPFESTTPSVPVLEPDAKDVPPPESLLRTMELAFEGYPPSKAELFDWHLQLRMTQVALTEVLEGAEGAEAGWLDVFAWVAERKGPVAAADTPNAPRQSFDGLRRSMDRSSQHHPTIPNNSTTQPSEHLGAHDFEVRVYPDHGLGTSSDKPHSSTTESLLMPIPITISPATPDADKIEVLAMGVTSPTESDNDWDEARKESRMKEKDRKHSPGFPSKMQKRSSSLERDSRGDTMKSKKVQQMLKDQVHKGRAGITAVSRKIGHGITRNGGLRRSSSTPDFHAVFLQTSYQASSIHSRRRLSSIIQSNDRTPTESPPPPPPTLPPITPNQVDFKLKNDRSAKENRLLSDLWLMSAATFRRLGKIEQSRGSIQEAEVRDQTNPNVWVQLGLYYVALGHYQHAVDTFQKALFISPDNVSATVHLSRLYLDPEVSSKLQQASRTPTNSSASSTTSTAANSSSSNADADLAAGILAYLTKGRGWDVPEAWYFLAKAYRTQGRKQKEMETLKFALELSEQRGVRDIESAIGWCT